MVRVRSRTLVGRAAELALLGEVLDAAAAGDPGALVLTGDAGVGKTRLLDAALARATAAGFLVLAGHAAPLSAGAAPLLPLADAFHGLRAEVGPDAWAALATDLPPGFGWLLPGAPATDAADRSAAPFEHARLLELVVRLLRDLASDRPVVLAVDDAHWADATTRDVLAFLVRALRRERLAVLTAVRAEALAGDAALRTWMAELTRAPRARELRVPPLPGAAIAELVGDVLERPPDPALAERIARRSGGNAFFAEELLAGGHDLPPTLREALLARLAGLGAGALRVTRAAAAAGRPCDANLLAAVTGLAHDEVDDAVSEAVAHAVLVTADGRVAFRHDLVREAVHAALPPAERVRLHAALAEACPGDPAAAAVHWREAGRPDRAIAASIAAARAAAARHAYRAAFDGYAAAIGLGEDAFDVLADAADAAGRCGRMDDAIALTARALEAAPDVEAAGRLHSARGWHLFRVGRDAEGLAALLLGARTLPREATPVRARALAQLALGLQLGGRVEAGGWVAGEALRDARLCGEAGAEGVAWSALGIGLSITGRNDAAVSCHERAQRLARVGGAPFDEGRALVNLTDALGRAGRWEEGVARAVEGAARLRDLGLLEASGDFLPGNAAWILLQLGRWDEAAALVAELAASRNDAAGAFAAVLAAELALGRGRVDEARAGLDGLERLGAAVVRTDMATAWHDLRAELHRRDGAFDAAGAEARAAVEASAAVGDAVLATMALARGVAIAADQAAAARARRDAAALARAGQLLEALLATAPPPARRPSSRFLGALDAEVAAQRARAAGREDPAAWRLAQERWAALGARPREAAARVRHAEALLAGGGARDEAAALLGPALAWAREAGAAPLRREVELLAAAARLDPDAGRARPAAAAAEVPEAAAAHGLTPRELEVLELLAAGRTNRQIAEALVITTKTAGHHVQRVLGKLGVHTRAEAGAVARRAGLVDDEVLARHLAVAPHRAGAT